MPPADSWHLEAIREKLAAVAQAAKMMSSNRNRTSGAPHIFGKTRDQLACYGREGQHIEHCS